MRVRICCQALWIPVAGLMLCGLVASLFPIVAAAEGSRTGNASTVTAERIHVSARIIRGPQPLMKEFQSTLPLSPIQGVAALQGFPCQQAILSEEQVTDAVRWIEKHKSLSITTIPQETFLDGKQGEIEFLKGRIAEIPVPQNGINQISVRQMSEGIKVKLTSSREADGTLLKSDWDSREFVSLKKSTIAAPDGKKSVRSLPGPMKSIHFLMESTLSDGQTLVVSGFTWSGGTKKTEAIVLLLGIAPVESR